MSRVGLVVHEGRPAAVEAAERLGTALAGDGIEVVDATVTSEGLALVVSIGGDGTFLRGAHVAAHVDAPILGVKVGRVGFLTEAEPPAAIDLVRAAVAGAATVEERIAVIAEPEEGSAFAPQWGMNEIMVEKRARHRLVRLAVEVDGDYVTTFSADGVIVATPTGSTAYSFSARGPIVAPDVPCLVLTPIAAHMVFDRSFVLADDQVVTLEVVGDEPGIVSADGRESVEVPVGTRVRIRAAERSVRFVRGAPGRGFLARVRDKFDLPGDPHDPAGMGSG
jgi:NAD+ kinase